MIAYIAFVAVANVLLGFWLGRMVPPSKIRAWRAGGSQQQPADRVVKLPSSATIRIKPTLPEIRHSEPKAEPESQELKNHSAPPPPLKTWADFAEQLRDVKDRTRYCRLAQDKRLARQAAEQLKACASVWYAQLEKCITGEPLDEATQSLVAGADPSALEMFAAQIETTLTNLGALDWNGSPLDVLNCLERELGLLDQQQKAVLKSITRAAVTAGKS
jgi:hypothetical protein